MQTKNLLRLILIIVVILEFVLSIMLLFYFTPKSSIQSDSSLPIKNVVISPKQEQAGSGLPARLKIPEINVDATIENVGLTSSGAMDIPKNPDNVAWFELGQRPGENGSAVMSGHYGIWKNGNGSVFDNLRKLRKGDKLYVENDKGVSVSFIVQKSRRYDAEADTSDIFSSNDGKSHLNLITCEGWDKVSKSYSKRLVIFADKE